MKTFGRWMMVKAAQECGSINATEVHVEEW